MNKATLETSGELAVREFESVRSTQYQLSVNTGTVDAIDSTDPAAWLEEGSHLWGCLIQNALTSNSGGCTRRIFVLKQKSKDPFYISNLATVLEIHRALSIQYGLASARQVKPPLAVDMVLYDQKYLWQEERPSVGTFSTCNSLVERVSKNYQQLWRSEEVNTQQYATDWLYKKTNLVNWSKVSQARLDFEEAIKKAAHDRFDKVRLKAFANGNQQSKYRIRPDVFAETRSSGERPLMAISYDFGRRECLASVSTAQADAIEQISQGDVIDIDALSYEELEALALFVDKGWVVPETANDEGRYERQQAYFASRKYREDPIESQNQLAASKVAVIGCGGVGSNLAMMLSMAGVRDFLLIDPDVVEESNLNRQIPFGSGGSVGVTKVDCLASYLSNQTPETHVWPLKSKLNQASLASIVSYEPNLVVVAADHPSIGSVISEATTLPKPFPILVAGGYYGPFSFSGPFFGNSRPCNGCVERFFGQRSEKARPNIGGTIGPIAVHAAAESSAVATHFLTGILSPNHNIRSGVIEFDHDKGSSRTILFEYCEKCDDKNA